MASPTQSLATAVDGLLAETVAGALGPTPPKRKLDELGAACQSPNEASAAAEAAAEAARFEAQEEALPAKKARASPPAASSAFKPAAPAPAAAVAPIHNTAPFLPPSAVDLEAVVDELLASTSPAPSPADELPSTQPLVSTQLAAADAPMEPEPAAPVPAIATTAAATATPAPTSATPPPAPTTDKPMAAAAKPESSLGVEELELLPTQPADSAGSRASAAAQPPACLHAAPTSCPALEPAAVVLESQPGASALLGDSAVLPSAAHPPAHHALPASAPLSPPPPAAAAACMHTCMPARPAGPEPTAAAAVPPAKTESAYVNLLKPGVVISEDGSSPTSSWGDAAIDGSWGTTSGSEGSCSPPSESPLQAMEHSEQRVKPPSQIAEYTVDARYVGSGGLGTVYPATHQPSGAAVALKLGCCMVAAEGRNDFTWSTFRTEWNTYAELAGRGLPWLPETYECGLVQVGGGQAPWLTMSLLGPSMHTLNQRHLAALKKDASAAVPGGGLPHLGAYARGMLAALEGLHSQGFIHHDVKPANFCVARDHSLLGGGVARVPGRAPQVFLIDFGFAHRYKPTQAGRHMEFVGTPDFASSAALLSNAPGPRDDLEALGYSLVELALGDLPWDVTQKETVPGTDLAARQEASAWTQAALHRMLERRDAAWAAVVADGTMPRWLVGWVEYCRSLLPAATPDYAHLRRLIASGEREGVTAAAAAAKAAGGHGWAWAVAEE